MKQILQYLLQKRTLSRAEAHQLLKAIAAAQYNQAQVTAFITVFMLRDITVNELSGFRDALLELRIPVDLSDYNTIDIVGTGGDGKNTFNISTLSSIVVAGAGYHVAKHGSTGVSSACGSSNVMEHFGYQFTNDNKELQQRMEQHGIVFMHAPLFHPALKAVAPIRAALGLRTIFNLLGPVVNPSCPKNMMLGVSNMEMARLYEYLFQDTEHHYAIVHSFDGYDEISLTGKFKRITQHDVLLGTAADIGLETATPEALSGGRSVQEAAAVFGRILNREGSKAQHDVVIANSGFAIKTICPEKSIDDCLDEARESLMSGKALKKLKAIMG